LGDGHFENPEIGMREQHVALLVFIVVLAAAAIWVDMPSGHPENIKQLLVWQGVPETRDIRIRQGLDLQGGTQVLLESDLPGGRKPEAGAMVAVRHVVENRVNGLGVSEPLIQLQGDNRLVVELPGLSNPDLAIKTLGQTGLLEFVDAGSTFLPEGTLVETTGFVEPGTTPLSSPSPSPVPSRPTLTGTPTAPITPTAEITPTVPITPTTPFAGIKFRTVMEGRHLQTARVDFTQTNQPQIAFSLTPEGAKIFADHTAKNVGKYLAIVLDKRVISAPVIQSAIPGGQGVITGKFTAQEAEALVVQLRYGALPVPLKVVENRTVGPTLGQDSVARSLVAGQIGIAAVVLFMLFYYRLPGFLATLALGVYGAIVLALFKLIPIVLTLAGIAGFVLSIGMAVDANILIFERMKEELRAGKILRAAIEAGFARAWPSIRDSNFSTLITCVILFWFGSNFGASIVKGFAVTLAIGVLVSMFTAITVTRSLLRVTQALFLSEWGTIEKRGLRVLLGL